MILVGKISATKRAQLRKGETFSAFQTQANRNDFNAQKAAVDIVTELTEFVIQEWRRCAESDAANIWEKLAELSSELHDCVNCLESVRKYHVVKSNSLSCDPQRVAYCKRDHSNLPAVVAASSSFTDPPELAK